MTLEEAKKQLGFWRKIALKGVERTDVLSAPGLYWMHMGEQVAYGLAVELLEKTSSPEIKTGKWIRVHGYATPGGDPVWRCSECGKGEHVWGIEGPTYGGKIAENQWAACPNCGTIMEGEEW